MLTQTFYKDFSIYCFSLRRKKGEGFYHNFLFQTSLFSLTKTLPTLCSGFDGTHTQKGFGTKSLASL